MHNYICKIGSLDEVIAIHNENLLKSKDKDNWTYWKDQAIKNVQEGKVIYYYGILNNEIICEAASALDKSAIQNGDDLVNKIRAYLFAFRTKKEYQNKGYFSKLFKFMLNDLKTRGYLEFTLGVEEQELRNRAIYNHYGFNEFIKKDYEYEPNGNKYKVLYYLKRW